MEVDSKCILLQEVLRQLSFTAPDLALPIQLAFTLVVDNNHLEGTGPIRWRVIDLEEDMVVVESSQLTRG